MQYTKQQLIQAFCEMKGCEVSDLLKIEQDMQTQLDENILRLQTELDNAPKIAKKLMTQTAINYLATKQAELIKLDNQDVTI